MPELYLAIYRHVARGELALAREIQDACCHVIYDMCSGTGNMYAVIKAVLREMGGPDVGGVRPPLTDTAPGDREMICRCAAKIRELTAKYA